MKDDTNNLCAARWTDDPVEREKFMVDIDPTVNCACGYVCHRYRVPMFQEDIASDVRAKLWQQTLEVDAAGPFATAVRKTSRKEAVACLLKGFPILEQARSLARKIAKTRSRQAEMMANVTAPELPPDVTKDLFAIAYSVKEMVAGTPTLTKMEGEMLTAETLRLVNLDDLPESLFDQAAQIAGTSGAAQRDHNKTYEEEGGLNPRKRKTLSRARAKVSKAFSRAALLSLLPVLVAVFALSLALCRDTHQNRPDHQGDVVASQDQADHQGDVVASQLRSIHQERFA